MTSVKAKKYNCLNFSVNKMVEFFEHETNKLFCELEISKTNEFNNYITIATNSEALFSRHEMEYKIKSMLEQLKKQVGKNKLTNCLVHEDNVLFYYKSEKIPIEIYIKNKNELTIRLYY